MKADGIALVASGVLDSEDAPEAEWGRRLLARVRGTLTGALRNPRVALVGEADALTLPGGAEVRNASVKLDGTLDAHVAELSAQAPAYALDITARLRGAYRALGWAGEIAALRNAGAFPLELSAPAPLRVSVERIELGRFDARLAEGRAPRLGEAPRAGTRAPRLGGRPLTAH